MAGREDRRGRVSAARRRAEQHTSGFETTVLRVPEGVGFYELKPGTHLVNVIPYTVKKGKDTPGGNPFAEAGELYYERTFWSYKKIGTDEKSYVCSSKTFGEPDFIQEYRQKESKNPAADADYLKALAPKERQIWLLQDVKDPDKGIQILEISYHLFGKLLDSRIKNSTEDDGWDLFYFPDEDGLTLRLTVEEVSGGGYTYTEVTAIDFVKRKEPIPEKIIKHTIDLDELPVKTPYEKLKDIFLGVHDGKQKDEPSDKSDDKSKDEPKKEEPKKESTLPTAEKAGLKVKDDVRYRGKTCTIIKISPDGTSLTLMDNDDAEVFKAIGVAEVELIGKEAKKEEPKKEEPKSESKKEEPKKEEAPKSEEKKEDKWDDDWS